MSLFIAALVAPAVGPVVYKLLHPRERVVHWVDAFVYLAVPVLIAVQVVPVAWEEWSVLPLVLVVAGALIPVGMERASRLLEHRTDAVALIVGLSGLVLHALLEGGAFAPGSGGGAVDPLFATAVILHRVPVGLVIWWLIRPRYGQPLAALGVASVVLSTLAGYGLGAELFGGTHPHEFELYQAFVSGSLLHVVFHQGRHDHSHDGHHHHGHRGHDHDSGDADPSGRA